MSSNQTFNPVGILPPFAGFIPEGATVISLFNSTSSKAFTAGEIVQLVPEGTDAVALTTQTSGDFVDMSIGTRSQDTACRIRFDRPVPGASRRDSAPDRPDCKSVRG